jgi:hypothetical protein
VDLGEIEENALDRYCKHFTGWYTVFRMFCLFLAQIEEVLVELLIFKRILIFLYYQGHIFINFNIPYSFKNFDQIPASRKYCILLQFENLMTIKRPLSI